VAEQRPDQADLALSVLLDGLRRRP
jgi:hypothetical protein